MGQVGAELSHLLIDERRLSVAVGLEVDVELTLAKGSTFLSSFCFG
jgi:hypothetical protein